MQNLKTQQRRKLRVRGAIKASHLLRLTIHRTNKHIYAQIIDDAVGNTIAASSDGNLKITNANKSEAAKKVGQAIAEMAVKAKVNAVVFDRGAYKYHGRVKAVAEGAREGGLTF